MLVKGQSKQLPCAHAAVFLQTSLFLGRFSRIFYHQVSLTNQAAKTRE